MSEEEDTKIVKFNVGGTQYEVARSLVEMHPDTMLARIVSKEWQNNPSAEIFIERNGSRFEFVLDYLRDGKAVVPISMSREALLDDLKYFGMAWNPNDISYGKIQLGAALNTLSRNIDTLGKKTNMFRFAHYCLLRLYNDVQKRKDFPSSITFRVSKKDEGNFFEVCQNTSLDLDGWHRQHGEGKSKLLEICNEYGFSPQRIQQQESPLHPSYFVTLKLL